MTIKRRDFLGGTLAVAATGLLANACKTATGSAPDAAGPAAPPAKRLSLLILGGTNYLGPELVEAARARGHTLTLFNRGKSHPGKFPDLETIIGDRNGKLDGLKGRSWDAVIDTSGYKPQQVQDSASLLAGHVGQYVFISTISVYQDSRVAGLDESAPVQQLKVPIEKAGMESYGPLKALCEQAAQKAIPDGTTVIRPGLIVGPNDPTDRFTYWPARVARGGEVLCPGSPKDPVQFIDVRDLAVWTIGMIERRVLGTFNALGPAATIGIGDVLAACPQTPGAPATFTYVPSAFLDAQKVGAWMELPLWIPPEDDSSGLTQLSAKRAIAEGLTFRPVAETARDTLAWWQTLPADRQARLGHLDQHSAGLTPEKEAAVLQAFHATAKR